jgi:hypothetical protein
MAILRGGGEGKSDVANGRGNGRSPERQLQSATRRDQGDRHGAAGDGAAVTTSDYRAISFMSHSTNAARTFALARSVDSSNQ